MSRAAGGRACSLKIGRREGRLRFGEVEPGIASGRRQRPQRLDRLERAPGLPGLRLSGGEPQAVLEIVGILGA